ncbi:SubName: Full=Uncharacterized protein {ECO:0000313/EMBL:CCA74036.1} [Serendipita indica DSM 11827]|nr:SubName: Full=Uncharacterized protein {ECO:0000313/EMBL:CCA74036.1} [Serendipita indica DSM 11827]
MSALEYDDSSSLHLFSLSSLGNLLNDPDVEGAQLDFDELGSVGASAEKDIKLYFNPSLHSAGIVCGNSKSASNTFIKRIIKSHLRLADARVLILHTDNENPIPTACPLASDFADQGCKTYISPRRPFSISQLYANSGSPSNGLVESLSFKEEDISIKHVLQFFTPDPYITASLTNSREKNRVSSTITHILSQISEPFDLVRFNELIGEEKWDEEGETHVAIRQTLLTSLISALAGTEFEEDGRGAIKFSAVTLIDLTDPILHALRVDTVLMDMVLTAFLSQTAESPKLIALNNSHEYLGFGSSFERSIAHLSSDRHTKRMSLLLSTPDPSSITQEAWNALDYVACTGAASSAWSEMLRRHLSVQEKFASSNSLDIGSFGPGEVCIIPARGFNVPKDYGENSPWCTRIAAQELNRTTTLLSKRVVDTNTTADNVQGPKGAWKGLPWAQIAQPFVPRRSDPPENLLPPASPPFISAPARSPSPPLKHTSTSKVQVDNSTQAMPPSMNLDAFPVPFRPLVSGILILSSGKLDTLVDYLELRTQVGNNRVVKAMGWGSFTQLVREAAAAGYVDHLVRKGFDRVRLRKDPFAGPGWNGTTGLSNAQASRSPPPVPIDPMWYPSNYQKLMTAVVSLSRGVVHTRINFEDVRSLIGKKAEIKKMGWATFTSWVDAAQDKGYIRTGGSESKWIILLPFNRNT